MAKQQKSKPGCFSGFLHILVCAGNGTSPPVHPSDHVTELYETGQVHNVHSKKDATFEDISATPGVVARLMGLDSLPKTDFSMKRSTPDIVPRSRSVNFVDYLLNFDLVQGNYSHRRAKTSASFREVPASGRREKDHNFVVFQWDGNVIKEREVGFGFKGFEMGFEEEKQGKKQGKKQGSKNKEIERNQGKKNNKILKLKNEPRRVPSSKNGKRVQKQSEAKEFSNSSYKNSCGGSSSRSSSTQFSNKKKKEFVESSITKKVSKHKSQKKIESDYNSENLSPISVLDINDYPSLYGATFPDGSRPLASKSNWKCSSSISLSNGFEDSTSNNKGCVCSCTDIIRKAEYYSELMLKIHTLTEKDIRELDFASKSEYEDFEEICLVLEDKILDLLLHEVVKEVVEVSC